MSDKQTYKGFKVEDKVSVKQTDTAYDDVGEVTPDMVGTIKSFPPKVQKVKGLLFDGGDYFAYIVFEDRRAGIDICNLIKRD